MSETKTRRRPQLSREAMYQIIRNPLITEKATSAVRARPVRVPRAARAHQAGDQGRGRRVVRRQVLAVNTLVQKGKTKRFKGRPGVRSDVKKAMVRLAAGQSIDFTTGLA